MRRVEIERQAIAGALAKHNVTEAAKTLGASRRTLQARMRDYGMPPGQAGRPRQLLPYKVHAGTAVFVVLGMLGIVGGVAFARWWQNRKQSTKIGLDLLGT
jgi:Bacterial regulatory protein, Fis family